MKITWELAKDLGLIKINNPHISGLLPFESRYSAEKRWESEERIYSRNVEKAKELYKPDDLMLVEFPEEVIRKAAKKRYDEKV